jgi:hypothetical protein
MMRLSTAHMLRITIDQAHLEPVCLVSIYIVGTKIVMVDTAESHHVGYLCARANTYVANIFCSNSV